MLYLVIYYTEETTDYKVRESTQTLFDVSKFKNFIRSILMRWFCENNWDSNSLRKLRPVKEIPYLCEHYVQSNKM